MSIKRTYKFILEESDQSGTPYFLVKSRLCTEEDKFIVAQELFSGCDMDNITIEPYDDLVVNLDA